MLRRACSKGRPLSSFDVATASFAYLEKPVRREEIFYVDDHGNIRIPEDLRKKAAVGKHVKLELVDGRITIIPAEGD